MPPCPLRRARASLEPVMNRRRIAIASAVVALVACPTAALAYEAPGYAVEVTDSTPASGAPFTLTTEGAAAGDELTLTVTSTPASVPNSAIRVAGAVALPKTAPAAGDVTWTVTLSAAGSYRLAVTDDLGALLGDVTVTVAAAPGDPGTELGATGVDSLEMGLAAGGLVLVGGAALLVARRRRARHA